MGDANLRRKSLDPNKLQRNSDGNFRIHLQSTKAICRNRSLISTTDSLKLYEDQILFKHPILNEIDEASLQKRPLSLCFDLGSSGEETNTTGTSSTISSVSSSSSSSTNSRSDYSSSCKEDYENILEDEIQKGSKSNLCLENVFQDTNSEIFNFVSSEFSPKESVIITNSKKLCNCKQINVNILSNCDCEDSAILKENQANKKPLFEQSYDLNSPEDLEIIRLSVSDIDSPKVSKSLEFEIPAKEILEIIKIFNTNLVGMRMFEDHYKSLVCTAKIFVNLSDPVRMGSPTHFNNKSHVSDKTLFPRGFELVNIERSTTCKEIIEHLFEKFHIQENYCSYALFEHTVKLNEKDYLKRFGYEFSILGHLINMVRIEKQNFVTHFQCKRFVLQENEKTQINWSSFSISELWNFLRILEKEEKDRKEKIVNFYSELKAMIESQMRSTAP